MIKIYITAGVVNPTSEIMKIINQYFKKYDTRTIRTRELIGIVKIKFPNHNPKAMIDKTLASHQIEYGVTKQFIELPNKLPTIKTIAYDRR